MKHKTLIHSLYEIGAIKFGNFTLKSGQSSPIYLDLRQIVSYPNLLQEVANAMWEKISPYHFDLVCGVPYTALPIATCVSILHNKPMILRRKEKKEYGTKQQIEGAFKKGQNCLIIEDVITSGASILETANDLINAGLEISHIVVLINREQGGEKNLEKNHFQLHAIFTLKQVLQELVHSHLLTEPENKIVTSLLNEYL